VVGHSSSPPALGFSLRDHRAASRGGHPRGWRRSGRARHCLVTG
jgi:hypothetical protein